MTVAPDGSPIALYLTLPGEDEAALIHAAIPPGAPILELGCGVGRVTRHLVALGHPVTGVDNSTAMLAEASKLNGVETLLADIATLDLSPRAWPAVVLASRMVNDEAGPDLLEAASRHVADSGTLLVERHEPGWIDAARPESGNRHGVSFRLAEVEHPALGVLHATMIYEVDGGTYRQPFVAYEVDDERLDAMAATVGLRVTGFLDASRTWVALHPF